MKMKKLLITLFLVVNIVCFSSGCDKNKKEEAKFIFGTDFCKYEMYVNTGDNIGINIPFAYNVSKDNINLISVEGENIEASEINFFDDTIEPCNNAEVNGYKLGYFGFIVENCQKSFTVNKLNIEIAGHKETIDFETPLVIKICNNGAEMYEGTTADYIGGGGKNRLMYSVFAEEELSITGYSFTGDYIIEETDITVDDKTVIKLPCELRKDKSILFTLNTNTSDEDKYKSMGFNFIVEYTNKAGEEKTFYVVVRQQGAGDDESCKELLKLIVEE